MIYSTYGNGLYYLEFREETPGLGRDNKKYWTLFKRNYIQPVEIAGMNFEEGHPWNLMDGIVDKPDLITAQTEEFLKFIVEALNEKVNRMRQLSKEVKKIEDDLDEEDDGGEIQCNKGL